MEIAGITLSPSEEISHTPKQIKDFEELIGEIIKCRYALDEVREKYRPISFLTEERLKRFVENKGYFISLVPDLYTDGVNWNWQIFWYRPKEKWTGTYDSKLDLFDGTFSYGDNHQYPTLNEALYSALEMCFRFININLVTNKPF